MDADQVGIGAPGVDPLGAQAEVDVGVKVDEAGRDQGAPDVHDPPGRVLDVGRDPRDPALLDRDVQAAVQAVARREHGAALDHEVVHEGSSVLPYLTDQSTRQERR